MTDQEMVHQHRLKQAEELLEAMLEHEWTDENGRLVT